MLILMLVMLMAENGAAFHAGSVHEPASQS
jgi:hypothetical protein